MGGKFRAASFALAAVGMSLSLAACAGSDAKPIKADGASRATAPQKPITYYGQTASVIAAMIPGCTGVQVGDTGGGSASGLSSTATCSLNGRLVDVNSWASQSDRDGVRALITADKVESYYAQGTGWTVTTHDTGTLQMQVTNDAAGLISQSTEQTSSPTTPPDLQGQRVAAEAVAAALDGDVVHVTS